jgi:hypothetical protein
MSIQTFLVMYLLIILSTIVLGLFGILSVGVCMVIVLISTVAYMIRGAVSILND